MGLMLHSELTKRLYDLLGASPLPLSQRIDKIVQDTAGGVNREGGTLDAVITDHAPTSDAGKVSNTIATASDTAILQPGHDTGFKWGPKSLAELKGVHPRLALCATTALQRFSTVDFMCYDGLRTLAEQAHYVKIGTSQTLQSMHLPQKDGYGHAVDLVPVVGWIPKWDWLLIYSVAKAMWEAAHYYDIANHIRWGGAWDKMLSDFNDTTDFRLAVQGYEQRHPGKDFIDGPHFEWRD